MGIILPRFRHYEGSECLRTAAPLEVPAHLARRATPGACGLAAIEHHPGSIISQVTLDHSDDLGILEDIPQQPSSSATIPRPFQEVSRKARRPFGEASVIYRRLTASIWRTSLTFTYPSRPSPFCFQTSFH